MAAQSHTSGLYDLSFQFVGRIGSYSLLQGRQGKTGSGGETGGAGAAENPAMVLLLQLTFFLRQPFELCVVHPASCGWCSLDKNTTSLTRFNTESGVALPLT